jgi:hypothetical protein
MARNIPPRDPRAALGREIRASRRIGKGRKCTKCGESRALIPKSDPLVCAECDRGLRGKSRRDNHHIAGCKNNPMTISIPTNHHRAELSAAQYDWPRKTLENPDRSPLLSAAAHIRGFRDFLSYFVEEFLPWIAEMLELLDTMMERKSGKKWWKHTKLKAFEPET